MSEENVLEPLKQFMVNVKDLNPDPDNARQHDKKNIEAVKDSLKSYGQHQPIIVQEEGMIVRIGNARLQAAKELGWNQIAALVLSEDNAKSIARGIADNRSGELGSWDYEILGSLISNLSEDGSEFVSMLGFDSMEIDTISAMAGEEIVAYDYDQSVEDSTKYANLDVEQKKEIYDTTTVRSMQLVFEEKGYDQFMEKLNVIKEKYGVENNTDMITQIVMDFKIDE